ncbi:hypothetical protein E4U57_001188 [Claviceps arundinis]|uniref:GTP-binding protein 2 n=1 Tax=Claviceps arundinis TaxID=1623583 RepID=A0A9P7MYK9_9HYPO|nr:hypothetical protein E4U57_001188 [Claviceps arundinis]KAG5975844.1 hypothetical protein E4U56_003178 [Claviceps arundinis]
MASIFTYDPDPPRVSSPWTASEGVIVSNSLPRHATNPGLLSEYGVKKLQAEPQEGPTEYKLHLLLRPRRSYLSMSTAQVPDNSLPPAHTRNICSTATTTITPALSLSTSSNQIRCERLKHLTTQLLWRLQQSCPYHSTSSKELRIPKLPENALDLASSIELEPLVPGLEESRGALYEIGVSDDGSLVGLTEDEMADSLTTLRVMAASLGCTVKVLRMITVGECEWAEPTDSIDRQSHEAAAATAVKCGNLCVAEALVMPHLGLNNGARTRRNGESLSLHETEEVASSTPDSIALPSRGSSPTPQLRITLTGPTTSGKSSLLGTLSTGTLDNGRGKSRLSLLRHRHEMASGVTSSIAQELVGYKDDSILNFSQPNIESWVDIHDCAEGGRLVFLSDSGGHPRFRRTVLRGLMNWAPHWSILCIAGDVPENASIGVDATLPSAKDAPSCSSSMPSSSSPFAAAAAAAAANTNLSHAHLNLVLKLDVPMAIVITKLDLASKQSLQQTMTHLLAAIKKAGRVPKILQPDQVQHGDDLQEIPGTDVRKVENLVQSIVESGDFTSHVPIVLTSAVNGTGMGLVHALLSRLPLPPAPTSRDYIGLALNPEQPRCLFHIDDTFSLPTSYCALATGFELSANQGIVLSGHVRFGSLSVGDKVIIGPFQPEDEDSLDFRVASEERPSPGGFGLLASNLSSSAPAQIPMKNMVSASTIPGEWHNAQIVSIRNLRLPVRNLEAGQAGSIGVAFEPMPNTQSLASSTRSPRVRRGMVVAIPSKHMLETGLTLQAASGFTGLFQDLTICSLNIGSFVHVYIASVRAVGRVLHVSRHAPKYQSKSPDAGSDEADDVFGLGSDVEDGECSKDDGGSGRWCGEVSLELLHNREWIEMGSKVVILEGATQDRSGLEGFAGKVIEIFD